MALPGRTGRVSFRCLLEQVIAKLGFPEPVYEITDLGNNAIKLHVETPDIGPLTYPFTSGQASSLRDACDCAAEEALRHLHAEYNFSIHDLTSERVRAYERCARLFDLKRASLEDGCGQPGEAPSVVRGRVTGANYPFVVHIDYLDVLRSVSAEISARVSSVEHLAFEPTWNVAWLTIRCPGDVTEYVISDRCVSEESARLSAAKKVVAYELCKYNLEVIDFNYGLQKHAAIHCALSRESYMYVQECVLGVQGGCHLPVVCHDPDYQTPTGANRMIQTLASPPDPPKKKKARPGFGSSPSVLRAAGMNLVRVPPCLEIVFKRKKTV